MAYCPHCGAGNRPGAQFCGTCGASLHGAVSARAAYPYRRGPSLWSAIVSALPNILILLTLGGIIYYVVKNADALKALLPSAPIVIMLPTVSTADSAQGNEPANVPPPANDSSASSGSPTFTASQDALCRAGPSKSYEVKTSINSGQSAPVIGRSTPEWADWWQVNMSGVKCWVWSGLGNFSGDASQVPVVAVDLPAGASHYVVMINETDATVCALDFIPAQGEPKLYDDLALQKGGKSSLEVVPGSNTIKVYFSSHANPCGFVIDSYEVNIDPATVGMITIYQDSLSLPAVKNAPSGGGSGSTCGSAPAVTDIAGYESWCSCMGGSLAMFYPAGNAPFGACQLP